MSEKIHIVCPSCSAVNSLPESRLKDNPVCGGCKAKLFNSRPLALTGANFQKHLSHNHIPLVVDFWAAWCGPCKMMAPVFEQAASQLEPYVRLAKVDTEAETGIASMFSIRSIPTIIIFKNGREAARNSGAVDLKSLVKWVRSHI